MRKEERNTIIILKILNKVKVKLGVDKVQFELEPFEN